MTEASGGLDARHEIKFAAYSTEYPALRHWLQMHPAGFVTAFPDRYISNIYFDSWDYRAYAENLAGISQRAKVRYRWYGMTARIGTGSLEVKQKRNHFGFKQRFAVTQPPYLPYATWTEIRASLREQLPANGRLWLDANPLPVMLNRYVREYFQTADGRIRATIDRQQQVFDQRVSSVPNFERPAITQDTLVVEFKFARADRQLAVALLANMPLRVGRHSKYMNAVRAIAMVR
jgi:hypothetical protein